MNCTLLKTLLLALLVALPTGLFARDEKAVLAQALSARVDVLYREIEPKVAGASSILAATALVCVLESMGGRAE